ncbi:MAG: type II toxin-antitoxin system RelE/ParE family toxin [Bacteroidetes bacterium]|nr:type II toxin-antitoxin system RelE/ParE family toxin [Bacteroidota bacterium]
MKYTVELSSKAKKVLKQIDKYQAKLIAHWLFANIDQCTNPREYGKPLSENLKGYWCYRVGNYRIVCEIKDKELIVIAVNIGHRRDIYR